MDILQTVRALVLRGRYQFTRKAEEEMADSGLTEPEVMEALMNAPGIHKILRSRRRPPGSKREKSYVIQGLTYGGILVYTKGAIRRPAGLETFYVLISAKRSVYWK